MPPEALDELRTAFSNSETAEDFVDRIFVGDCPKCGSEETGNCDADPEIEELLVGRCYRCGQLWYTECGGLLERDSPSCACWEQDE
jgi:transcription elongation factor Elf1